MDMRLRGQNSNWGLHKLRRVNCFCSILIALYRSTVMMLLRLLDVARGVKKKEAETAEEKDLF